ncbi:type II toxin-antitoxin system YafQ family toxin [Candidatus Parcubacteria bacterium]|nr:type II toxin-antitoxin system YafQ family toxin [Candidatus Parcubacteria bacterium]
MYIVVRTKKFKKALNKINRSGYLKNREDLERVVYLLKKDQKLPLKYKDHQLKGEFKEYRECHIKGDLLLIYKIVEDELILVLINIGSHSSLKL